MGRLVALKLIRKDRMANADVARRFHREIRAASQVIHPNVVIAYDADQVGDTHFLVMEYVQGTDLAKTLKQQGPLGIDKACDYVRQAALGLQHAHEKGLVHRDIKPANLLLTADGITVKILDLGLARVQQVANEQTLGELTAEGSVMGTPDYIAPEQAQESHTVDIRADVYSLGCTLYHFLTGRVPFPGGNLGDKLIKHMLKEPEPLTALRPDVPAEVAALVQKLMAKKPEDRYQTPGELATALAPFSGPGAPVAIPVLPAGFVGGDGPTTSSASSQTAAAPLAIPIALLRPPSESTIALPPVAVAIAPLATPVEQTPTPGSVESVTATPASVPPSAPPAPSRWQAMHEIVRRRWHGLTVKQRWIALGSGSGVLLGLVLFLVLLPSRKKDEGLPPPPPPDTRGVLDRLDPMKIPAEDRYDWQPKQLVAVLGEHRLRTPNPINALALRPDGKASAVIAGGTVYLLDPETVHQLRALPFNQATAVALSPDGKTLAAGGSDKTVRLWNVNTGAERKPFEGHEGPVTCVAFSPDGKLLASGSQDKSVIVWMVKDGTEVTRFKEHTTPVLTLAFAGSGRQILSGGGGSDPKDAKPIDCELRLWEVETGNETRTFPGHSKPIVRVAVSPDGLRAYSSSQDGTLRLWDMKTHKEAAPSIAAQGTAPFQAVSFSADGSRAVAAAGPQIYLLDTATNRVLRIIPQEIAVADLALFPDGLRVLFPQHNTLRLWDMVEDKEVRPQFGHQAGVQSIDFSSDGRYLISGGKDKAVCVWDFEKIQNVRTLHHDNSVVSLAVTPDLRFIFSSALRSPSNNPPIREWDFESGRTVRDFGPGTPTPPQLALSPDGRTLASTVPDGFLHLWDVESDQEKAKLEWPKKNPVRVGFLTNKQVFALNNQGEVAIWGVASKKLLRELPLAGALCVVFSPDRKQAFTGHGDGHVRQWDLSDAKAKGPLHTWLRWHQSPVLHITLSADGKRLVSGSADNRIIEWNVASRKKVWEWPPSGGSNPPFNALLLAPDGRHLAVANENTTIYILRLADEAGNAEAAR
jgi:WD40 repeat protein